MKKLTAIVPCKNEEHNIDQVLESVKWVDEVMVVDSFSTDNTVEIAKRHTEFVLQHEYVNSASQKNWAIPQASNEWILLVDADERVTPELKLEIQKILTSETDCVGYWIYRDNYFMGKHLKYGGVRGDRVIRLFKRDSCNYQDKNVHAEVVANGKIGVMESKLIHNTYKDLGHYLEKIQRYSLWSAKDYDSKTGTIHIYHLIIKPGFKFFQFYVLKGGFLDGFVGFVVAALSGYSVLLRYIQLWSLRRLSK